MPFADGQITVAGREDLESATQRRIKGRARIEGAVTMNSCELALFPIRSVLFPGGITTLPIREARHLDVIVEVLKSDHKLGVVLAEDGE